MPSWTRKPRGSAVVLCILGAISSGCSSDDDADAQGGTGGSAGATSDAGGSDAAGSGGAATEGGALDPIVDLRADTNRDGRVDLTGSTDEEGEESWDAEHGAIFLANLDDDEQTCPGDILVSDGDLAACHDAADDVVNGADDLLDMARLQTVPWPDAPQDASGTLEIAAPGRAFVRLFVRRGDAFTALPPDGSLSAQQLREGVEFALEGTDIVRDAAAWDGYVDVTLRVNGGTGQSGPAAGGADTVRLRVAPIVFSHHLQPVESLYASSSALLAGKAFLADLDAAATAAGVPGGLTEVSVPGQDQWTQDLFETGAMSMPAAGGQQHVIFVFVRSANLWNVGGTPGGGGANKILRRGGRIVFTHFRGKDVAGVQEVDMSHEPAMDTLNSFGNTETIPPYTHNGNAYPLGRVIRGSTPTFYPDRKMSLLIESQAVQPVLTVDTSWLLVAHVDETISYIRADTPLGFSVIVNDPVMARQMLQAAQTQGYGATEMFVGLIGLDENQDFSPATTTIDEVLADEDIMAMSAEAAVEVEAQLDVLRQAIGITEEDLIRVPFLHEEVFGRSVAYQPGTVNGVVLADQHFAAPDPHGPVIEGQDIFKKQMMDALGAKGVTVHFVEDWDVYHRLLGEVHCGSNAKRALPEGARWWEGGR